MSSQWSIKVINNRFIFYTFLIKNKETFFFKPVAVVAMQVGGVCADVTFLAVTKRGGEDGAALTERVER
jgi:hypothetical protein